MSDSKELSNELAEISIVKAFDLVDEMKDQNDLITTFNQIENSKDRALAVQSVLQTTPVFGVTQSFGTIMDRELQRIGVMDVMGDSVEGVESLGLTLMPQQYINSRLAGIESFLNIAVRQTAQLLTAMGESVRNRYVLLMESNNSLLKRLSALESELNRTPMRRTGVKELTLRTNANLFVVGGTIREDWGVQFEKLSKTIKALVNNYYRANQWTVNDLLGFFGGFANIDQPEAIERFKTLPKTLNGLVFEECVFPNRELSTADVKVRNSVELMGGRVFTNHMVQKKPANPKSVTEVSLWIQYFIGKEHVDFIKLPKPEFDSPPVIPSLGTAQIKTGIKLSRDILNEAAAIFSAGDKYSVLGNEFTDIVEMIEGSTWDQETKTAIKSAFESLAMKYNKELLSVRTQVVEYLTLLINGYIGLCLQSIDA